MMKSLITSVSFLLASSFYIGYVPGAPGTYAAGATVLIYYYFWARHGVSLNNFTSVIVLVVLVGLAVLVSNRVTKVQKDQDPSFVVIDEVVGQLIALYFIPERSWSLIAGFVLFRFFDITKPFPIRRLEALHGGWGIVLDDVGAGLYANVALQIASRLL